MSQQRVLETLKARRLRGERPAVQVGDQTFEFSGLMWGGVSPLVWLIDPDGASQSRTAAAWTKLGAKFLARSRDLAKVAPKASRGATRADLEHDIKAVVEGAKLDKLDNDDALTFGRYARDSGMSLSDALSDALAQGFGRHHMANVETGWHRADTERRHRLG